jgi:glycerophosphoryl diester phosphodiesterase
MRKGMKFLIAATIVATAVFIENTNIWIDRPSQSPNLLAHKGLWQSFDLTNIKGDDCTATRMLRPRQSFLENTIASIGEAFKVGADIVELDIHPTTDGQFADFHDWTLECRTNGTGVTRNVSIAYLRGLDIGYGYTTDGRKTFPFRGKGVGLMPSLDEVLAAFPEKWLLINIKSNDAAEGGMLVEHLSRLPSSRRKKLMAYGGDAPIEVVRHAFPEMRTMSRATRGSCYLQYIALGWSGYVPRACRNSVLLIPVNVGQWMWGWPHRF